MATSVESQLADLDPDVLLREFIDVLTLIGFDATAWEPGELAYDFSDGVTTWFCNTWNSRVAPRLRAQYLKRATGDDLSETSRNTYNRSRNESTFANGDVVIESRGVGVGTIGVGTLRIPNANGKTFTNVTSGFMALWSGSGPYTTVTLKFEADEAGAASNTSTNALPTYPTPPRAAPFGGLYVQSNAALLGADEESDEILRRRAQLAAAEEGLSTFERIEAHALDPVGAFKRYRRPVPSTWAPTVNVTRVRIIDGGSGSATVYLASPSGAASGDTVTADTDVYICNTVIQTLDGPAGGTLTVAPASEHAIAYGTIQIKIRRESLVTVADAEATASANLTAFFSKLPIGGERLTAGGQGYVLIDHVKAIALAGSGAYEVTFGGTSTDVSLAAYEVAVPTYTVQAILVTQGV